MCGQIVHLSLIMICFNSFCLQRVSAAGDCTVQTADNSTWNDYLISAVDNYSITAVCNCSIGKPYWQYYKEGASGFSSVNKNSISRYCVDNGGVCDPPEKNFINQPTAGLYVHAKLNNYLIKESTILLCGNSDDYHAAPGITIVISKAPEVCPNVTDATTITGSSVFTTHELASSSSLGSIFLLPSTSILPSPSSTTITTTPPTTSTTLLLMISSSPSAQSISSSNCDHDPTTTITVTTTTASVCSSTTPTAVNVAAEVAEPSTDKRDMPYTTVTVVLIAVCVTVFAMMAVVILILTVSLVAICKRKRPINGVTAIDEKETGTIKNNCTINVDS